MYVLQILKNMFKESRLHIIILYKVSSYENSVTNLQFYNLNRSKYIVNQKKKSPTYTSSEKEYAFATT